MEEARMIRHEPRDPRREEKRSLAAEVHARGLSSRSERELRRMKPGELRRLLARAEDRARSAEIAKERMTAEKETRE
jgi:hypothetical protein